MTLTTPLNGANGEKKMQAFQRTPAALVKISDILQGSFFKDDENQPSMLRLPSGQAVFRINLLATTLYKETAGMITTLLVDDGSGQVPLRCFEEKLGLDNIPIGSTLLVIGKVRSFSGETYISPEIVKKVVPLWLKVRAQFFEKEREKEKKSTPSEAAEKTFLEQKKEEAKDEAIPEEDMLLPTEKITRIIRDLDQGNGASIEEVIEKSPIDGTEQLLQRMREKGDIFQITPGKIKVL